MKMRTDGSGKWYVSVYHLYPIYEPAEGGYYYNGVELSETYEYNTRSNAIKCLRKLYKSCIEDGDTMKKGWHCNNDHTFFGVDGKYIGEGWFVQLERKKGMSERGWVPYE